VDVGGNFGLGETGVLDDSESMGQALIFFLETDFAEFGDGVMEAGLAGLAGREVVDHFDELGVVHTGEETKECSIRTVEAAQGILDDFSF
jgi:hypothetical protein